MENNLRAWRESVGKTREELADGLGISAVSVYRIEDGQQQPRPGLLASMCKMFGKSQSEFYSNETNVSEAKFTHNVQVPILDYVKAGHPAEIASRFGPDDVLGYKSIDVPPEEARDIFALVIDGPSMMPEFKPGDCVIMKRSLAPQPGDYVVAVNGEGEAVFKRYKVLKTDEQGRTVFALVPLNDDFPALRSDEGTLVIRATMIEHRRYRRR